jgi:hypothetical protein
MKVGKLAREGTYIYISLAAYYTTLLLGTLGRLALPVPCAPVLDTLVPSSIVPRGEALV